MNKEIIVTGAGQGLGKTITLSLIEDGFQVIAVDINDSSLDKLYLQSPENIKTICLDVSDNSAVEKFFASLQFDNIYGLVNNAGIYLGKNITQYTVDEVSHVLNVNLRSAIIFSNFFGNAMLSYNLHGAIINISSSSIHGGSDPVYSSSKAGLIGLTKSCAKVFSPFIRVNAVAPGIVKTNILKNIPQEIVASYRNSELIKQPLEAKDIANTVTFLFSKKGKNYTGTVFNLNNGCHM